MYKDYKNVQHRPFGPQITGESDFDIALEDIPVLEPSGIFRLWIWTMRVLGIGLIILGFLLLLHITDADASWAQTQSSDQPASVFHKSDRGKGSVNFEIFRFFDTKFQVLCYVNGAAMQCIPFHRLGDKGRSSIKKIVEQHMNHMQLPPKHIIKIP